MITLPLALASLFIGRGIARIALGFGAYLMMFTTAGITSLGAANNGTLLYAAIILAAIPGFRRDKWALFHTAVFVAAIFKPFYVTFWILPVLAHGFAWRQVLIGSIGNVLVAACYLFSYRSDTAEFAQWLVNLHEQIVTLGHTGINIFGAVTQRAGSHLPTFAPYAAQACFVLLMCINMLQMRCRGHVRWALLIIVAVFINPRLMPYDVAVTSIPVVALASTMVMRRFSPDVRLVAATFIFTAITMLSYRTIDVLSASVLFPTVVFFVMVAAARMSQSTTSSGLADYPRASTDREYLTRSDYPVLPTSR
jgi:hypothetical protein